MSLAKEINKKLDEIIDIKAELIKLKKELSSGAEMTNIQTGKPATKEDAVKVVEGMIADLESHLAKLTNNGQNVRGVFNNEFYINDVLQDKQIVKELERNKAQI
jgi:cell division septum initiation protein DivIVA